VCIALILGDGLYNFVKIIYVTLKTMYVQRRQRMQEIPITEINGEFLGFVKYGERFSKPECKFLVI